MIIYEPGEEQLSPNSTRQLTKNILSNTRKSALQRKKKMNNPKKFQNLEIVKLSSTDGKMDHLLH